MKMDMEENIFDWFGCINFQNFVHECGGFEVSVVVVLPLKKVEAYILMSKPNKLTLWAPFFWRYFCTYEYRLPGLGAL